MSKLIVVTAATLLAAGGCKPGGGTESSARASNTDAQSVGAENAASQSSSDIAPEATARPATDASIEAVLRDCLQHQAGPAPGNEKPPVNAGGLYANKGECRGCSTGWWHTAEPARLYAAPDLEAAQLMTVPSDTWLYALETVAWTIPTRGVVVKSGGRFSRCDVVYHVYTAFEEGESWATVWRQGELLTYEEDGDAAIQWVEPMPFVDLYRDDGWWVRLHGRNGETGWAWASARESEFACKWERDPDKICATAPAEPPPGQ